MAFVLIHGGAFTAGGWESPLLCLGDMAIPTKPQALAGILAKAAA